MKLFRPFTANKEEERATTALPPQHPVTLGTNLGLRTLRRANTTKKD